MEYITFDELKKIDIRMGKIISAEKVADSNKLLQLQVDFGLTSQVLPDGNILEVKEKRQILAGISKYYAPETVVGKWCPFVFNLAPKKMGELESQGMMLCADDGGPVLLHPDKEIKPGSIVK